MNTLKTNITIALMILAISLYAQNEYVLKANKVTVAGTSTLHDWESDVTKVEWSGTITIDDGKIAQVNNVLVRIPVESIKSTKGRIMDSKTYEAFNSEKNPYITYKLQHAELNGGVINANGQLTMAGATKAIPLKVKATVGANEEIRLSGSYEMKMTDYKMEPPTAVMGTIKVGDEVTIKFDLTVAPKNIAANK
ncbi:MAG: YceI family protein [Cyclobacteriaceae bacterium]|nr:YceI family protein [Cyclobacteriaceae bacterium]